MIKILITARVGGVEAVTTLAVENLKWLPLDAPHVIKDDRLPQRIDQISFHSEKGQVTQIINDFVVRIDP